MRLILFSIVALLLLGGSVSAIGIIPGYLVNKTLFLSPGETAHYYVSLENDANESVDVRFYVNSNVASISDGKENYILPPHSSDTSVMLNVSVHSSAILGSTYPVFYYLEERFNDSVNLSSTPTTRIAGKFYVSVTERKAEENSVAPGTETPPEELSFLELFNRDRAFSIWLNFIIGILVVTGVLIAVEVYYRKHSKNIAKIRKPEPLKKEAAPQERKKEAEIPPDKYFRVCNGMVFKSIEEFKNNLFSIDDLSFDYHVNKKKNDFANWIADVFNEKELADKLRRVYTKEAFNEILKK